MKNQLFTIITIFTIKERERGEMGFAPAFV